MVPLRLPNGGDKRDNHTRARPFRRPTNCSVDHHPSGQRSVCRVTGGFEESRRVCVFPIDQTELCDYGCLLDLSSTGSDSRETTVGGARWEILCDRIFTIPPNVTGRVTLGEMRFKFHRSRRVFLSPPPTHRLDRCT